MFFSTGSDKPQLSCIRITAMLVASNRLWIGTGIGVVISVPLLDSKILIHLILFWLFYILNSLHYTIFILLNSIIMCMLLLILFFFVEGLLGFSINKEVKVYSEPKTQEITPSTFTPYCSMAHAQLSVHGFRDAVKFFVSVPGLLKKKLWFFIYFYF